MPLGDGTGAAVLRWIVEAAGQYHDCAARQAGLVQAWPGASETPFSDAASSK